MEKMKGKILTYAIVAILIGTIPMPIVGTTIPLLSQNEIKIKNGTLSSDGNTLYVGGTGPNNYSKIQDAINDANDGDTVFVYDDSSPYYENVVVNKSINLIGENRDTTIIDGSQSGDAVYVSANWVNISGFTIKNSGNSGNDAGIDIRSNYANITDNNILNNGDGIFLYYSSKNDLSDNNISNNYMGLYLWDSNNNDISGNSFFDCSIFILYSYQNTISQNTVNGKPLVYLERESDIVIKEDAGQVILIDCDNITIQNQELSKAGVSIILWNTDNCLISGNNISKNDDGIRLYSSSKNYLSDNNISNNYMGLSLWDSSDNIISGNDISNNGDGGGILICEGGKNIVSGNNISNNGVGIFLLVSYFNVIKYNNFIKNSRHAGFSYESLLASFSNCWNRNYWDRPRIFPKPIFGRVVAKKFPLFLPWLNFDWFPLTKPYGE